MSVTSQAAAAPTTVTFDNTLPAGVIVYDSFASDTATNYVGDLTQLATIGANGSAPLTPLHPFASVFIVAHADTGVPIARFVWLKVKPQAGFSVGQADVDAMNETFAFIDFLTKNPSDPIAKSFLALIGDSSSDAVVDDVGQFFVKLADYKLVTFVTYMLGVTAVAQNKPSDPSPGQPPQYSLSRLAALLGGAWPSALPDIVVAKYRAENQNDTLMFWAEIDLTTLPAQGPGPIKFFVDVLGGEKIIFNIQFHYGLDLGIFGTRLMLRFDDIAIPLDPSTQLKVTQPTVTVDINPLFKFVVLGVKATIPFTIFGKSFDAIATLTIDNIEAAVGLVIEGDHASLPSPPELPGLHFDEFGVGMAIFFEPPGFALGLEGKFHIGGGGAGNVVPLDDDTFTIVLQIEDEVPNPLYASFYVPKLDLDTVLSLFTDTRTGIDVPVEFTDLSFVWAENPMEPVVLPDGTLSQAALGFRAGVDVLTFGFYGDVQLGLADGLTADVEVAPVSLGELFKLSGDGKGYVVKVDAQGNPIKNNVIRDKKTLQDVLASATDKAIVAPGGPVLRIQSLKAPFLHLSAKASLFDLVDYGVEADIDKNGVRFDLDFGGVLTEKMQVTLADFHNLAATLKFGVDRVIALPNVGPVSLGSLPLKTVVAAALQILTSTQNVTLTAGGGFDFEGLHFTVPGFTLDAHIAKITDFIEAFVAEISAEAGTIFAVILGDAGKWAGWVAKNVITGVSDMASVLKGAFNQTIDQAAAIMKGAGVAAETVATGIKGAYTATSAQVAAAMKAAGFAADQVGQAVRQAFGLTEQGLAQAMQGAGYIASDVGGVLKDTFGGDVNAAALALRAAGFGAAAVGGALKGLFTNDPGQAAAALRAAGFGAADVGQALKGTFVNSAQDAANALRAAGFGPLDIANVAKNVFGASTQEAAQILNQLGVAGDAANQILSAIGCPASEIADALKSIFDWPPHINLPHVKLPHVKF